MFNPTEADFIGLKLMNKAGYNAAEAIQVWERMMIVNSQQPPQFLSTHPSHQARIERLKALIQASKHKEPLQIVGHVTAEKRGNT